MMNLGHTLVAASALNTELREQLDGLNKSQQATRVGQLVAKRALDAGCEESRLRPRRLSLSTAGSRRWLTALARAG